MQSYGVSTTDREFVPTGDDPSKRSLMTTAADPGRKTHIGTTRNWTKNRWAKAARAEICGEKFHAGPGVDGARLDKMAKNKVALPQQVGGTVDDPPPVHHFVQPRSIVLPRSMHLSSLAHK